MSNPPAGSAPVGSFEEYYEFAELSITTCAASVCVASVLTGAILTGLHQILTRRKGAEPLSVKTLLAVVGFLVVLQNIFEIYGHFLQCKAAVRGLPSQDVVVPWTTVPTCLLACITGVLVQASFAWSVYRTLGHTLVRSLWLGLCGLFSASILASGLASSVVLSQMLHQPLSEHPLAFVPRARPLFMVWLFAGACYDVLLSSLLIAKFVRSIRSDGFPDTNSSLSSFIISTLETFSLTALTSVMAAVTTFLSDANEVAALKRAPYATYTLINLLTRFYAVSLVYALHRRAAARARLAQNRRHALMGRARTKPESILQAQTVVPFPPRQVRVTTETHCYLEGNEDRELVVATPRTARSSGDKPERLSATESDSGSPV